MNMDFERREDSLLPRPLFLRRMARWALAAGIVLLGSLALGVCGYHLTEGLPWIDALLNASMILSGMGPVDPLPTPVAKLFASFYALFCGVVFVGIVSVLIAPFAHRLLHRFHLEKGR